MPIASFTCSLLAILLLIGSAANAQETDLCAIRRDPTKFCGKMISVRGTFWSGIESGGLRNESCETVLLPIAPENAGMHVPFTLKRDKAWQKFSRYSAVSSDLNGEPSENIHYDVTATFHGLFACNRNKIPWFFLVVESVSDVKVAEHR